jgi:hypothetical protein
MLDLITNFDKLNLRAASVVLATINEVINCIYSDLKNILADN